MFDSIMKLLPFFQKIPDPLHPVSLHVDGGAISVTQPQQRHKKLHYI